MNEQIFELARQADLIQWDMLPSGARTPDHESVAKAMKFAELIVQKCIDIIEKVPNGYRDYRDQIEDGMRQACIDDVKNYFGVK